MACWLTPGFSYVSRALGISHAPSCLHWLPFLSPKALLSPGSVPVVLLTSPLHPSTPLTSPQALHVPSDCPVLLMDSLISADNLRGQSLTVGLPASQPLLRFDLSQRPHCCPSPPSLLFLALLVIHPTLFISSPNACPPILFHLQPKPSSQSWRLSVLTTVSSGQGWTSLPSL